jgi:hypothetical protein
MAAKAAAEGKRIAGLVCKKPAQRWKMLPIRNGAHCSRARSCLLGNSRFTAKLTGTSRAVWPIPPAQAGFLAEGMQA